MPENSATPKKSQLDRLREKHAQTVAQIRRLEAAEAQQRRKAETSRKIEIGALALHHMRENPDSEFYRIMRRLLNRYVPKHRRHLFTEEFGIEAEPPAQEPENTNVPTGLTSQFPSGLDRSSGQ